MSAKLTNKNYTVSFCHILYKFQQNYRKSLHIKLTAITAVDKLHITIEIYFMVTITQIVSQGHQYMLKEYFENNHYAKFDTAAEKQNLI